MRNYLLPCISSLLTKDFLLFKQSKASSPESDSDEMDSEPEYLQEFAKSLKAEFKNISVQEIFDEAKAVIKVSTSTLLL